MQATVDSLTRQWRIYGSLCRPVFGYILHSTLLPLITQLQNQVDTTSCLGDTQPSLMSPQAGGLSRQNEAWEMTVGTGHRST